MMTAAGEQSTYKTVNPHNRCHTLVDSAHAHQTFTHTVQHNQQAVKLMEMRDRVGEAVVVEVECAISLAESG